MNDKPQIGSVAARLAAAGIGTLISSILFSVALFIPPAGIVSCLLAPFPAVFVGLRHGRGASLMVLLAAAALVAAAFGIQASALYLLQCSVIALLMPELLRRGFGSARTIAWTTAGNLVVFLLAGLAFMLISGQDIQQLAVGEINASLAQAMELYGKSGIKGDDLAAMKHSMVTAANLLIRTYPALMTVTLIAMAGFSLTLVRRFAVLAESDLKLGEFNRFKNPEWLVWLLIAAGFSMLADNPIVTTPALNLLVVLALLYFLQGLAVVSTIIARQGHAGLLRLGLYLLLLFQPYVSALVVALGIFDLWGDFRTPRKQENL
jgi:uncharacterized protein YybS (DUF2232 family)